MDKWKMEKKRIRIVHIMATPSFSGPDATVLSIFEKLDPVRYRNYLIFLNSPGTVNQLLVERSRSLGIETVSFDTRGKINLLTLKKIISFTRKNRIQILHPHNYKTDILAYLASRFYPVKCVSTLHGFVNRNRKMRFYRRLDLKILKHFDRVKVVSRPLYSLAESVGICPDKLSLIPNAIDLALMVSGETEQESIRKEFTLNKKQPLIGMIGRLDKEKNPGLILDILPELIRLFPDLKCFFVGEGSLRGDLIRRAEEMGLNSMAVFTGYREDARTIISLLDVVIIPSWTEGIPKTLLESMAFEKPVVATRVGGVPDVIRDGKNGFLVPPGDPRVMADKVAFLLADSELRHRMGIAGRDLMVNEYSDRRMVSQMDEFYEKVLI